ncbi:MAG: ornithine cyclodeaminase family protein, partial [Chloroflexi bacterium]|nr:ornithine cyclodeaminase family protein [Chloroflexota bacterium]
EAALAEAGDIIQAIQQGLITPLHIHAELGEILLGQKPGRTSNDQITVFKSVGLAVQDAAAASVAMRNAASRDLGTSLKWE